MSGTARVNVKIEAAFEYEDGSAVNVDRLCEDLERVMRGVVGDGALTASDPSLLVDEYEIRVVPVCGDVQN